MRYMLFTILFIMVTVAATVIDRSQKQYEIENDLRITKTAEFAYFTGCAEISRDFTYCKVKAEIYAKELREAVLSGKDL